jgi:ATP-dependent Clp protease adaptor protein ClpS
MTTDTITDTKVKQKLKFPNMWRVIFHNDDFTPMDFVVEVLIKLFNKTVDEATDLMLTVHLKGRAQIAIYTKEIAEQKCNEVRRVAEAHGHPLLATAEEVT